jgi:hypothetical protein
MSMALPTSIAKDDPRQLRVLFERAVVCARLHKVPCVFIGIAGAEGDLMARDFLDFVESELRVEDPIFRMLRERAVLLMTDVCEATARRVIERLCADFASRYAPNGRLPVQFGFHEVAPNRTPTAKEVLPALFAGS